MEKGFFSEKNEAEIRDFLINQKLFETRYIATGNSSNIKNGILELIYNPNEAIVQPTKELVEDFYSYVMSIFEYDIKSQKFIFFSKFNDEIYGLPFTKQKKIALKYFIDIFNTNYKDVITLFELKTSENGIIQTHSSGKLKLIKGQHDAYKRNLIDEIKANQYLEGNKDFFSKENIYPKYPILNEIISFEICVQILVELNDRFNFEEDLYFSEIRFDKENFEKYSNIFKTLESYKFTNNKIKSFTEDHKAHIESLYQVLVEKKLIFNHKENFMKFLKEKYNLTITKIISYDKNINYSHDERVILFESEWSNLTSKKEQN